MLTINMSKPYMYMYSAKLAMVICDWFSKNGVCSVSIMEVKVLNRHFLSDCFEVGVLFECQGRRKLGESRGAKTF